MNATACSRSTRSFRRGLYSGALSAVLLLGLSGGAQTVTATDAMRKIKANRPCSDFPTGPSAAISAARNEFEAFQLCVQGPASNVSASVSCLTRAGGGQLCGATCGVPGNVRLYQEAIINITTASGGKHCGTGPYPDGLIPNVDEFDQQCRNAFPISQVPSGENRVIWVEVFVPLGTPAGDYTGNVVVTYTGGSTTIPVTLTVWDFDLPATASLHSYFGLNPVSLQQQHGVPLGSDAYAALRYRYSVFALDHRISTPHFDDGVHIDFNHPDLFWMHYDQWYSPLINGSAPESRLATAAMTKMDMVAGGTQLDDGRYYDAWASHFNNKGWFDRLFGYICDEPQDQGGICQWSQIPTRAALAHGGNPPHPNFRALVTTDIDSANGHNVSLYINILVPNVFARLDLTRSHYDTWLGSNPINEAWEYISCNSHGCAPNQLCPTVLDAWPDYVIDEESIQARALEWLTFKSRLSGELYYDTTVAYYTHLNPWTDQYDSGGNGDGTLFLPGTPTKVGGTTHIPVATLRMKMIREGMEDYEYMYTLDLHGDRLYAESQINNVFPNPLSTDPDPNLLYAARKNMACQILRDLGKPLPPACQPAIRR